MQIPGRIVHPEGKMCLEATCIIHEPARMMQTEVPGVREAGEVCHSEIRMMQISGPMMREPVLIRPNSRGLDGPRSPASPGLGPPRAAGYSVAIITLEALMTA